jgi:hypothetical protein
MQREARTSVTADGTLELKSRTAKVEMLAAWRKDQDWWVMLTALEKAKGETKVEASKAAHQSFLPLRAWRGLTKEVNRPSR